MESCHWYRLKYLSSNLKEQHGYTKTLEEYKSEKRASNDGHIYCDARDNMQRNDIANLKDGTFKQCDYESISNIFRKFV